MVLHVPGGRIFKPCSADGTLASTRVWV